jgi:hypothetical protein
MAAYDLSVARTRKTASLIGSTKSKAVVRMDNADCRSAVEGFLLAEPEIFRIIGEESKRVTTNRLTSRQINEVIRKARVQRKKTHD